MASQTEILVSADGTLQMGGLRFRCALGRGGVKAQKREGDGATPAGAFPLRGLLYRADRLAAPKTALPAKAITPEDGWCDDQADAAYNRQIRLPYPARAEKLWRDDALYDVVVVLGHNDDPPIPGMGSAIFLHVASSDYAPTEGCVALALADLLAVLRAAETKTLIRIKP